MVSSQPAKHDVTDEVKDAGRGVFLIAGAKVYFMLAGAVIVFSLPRIFDEATYGAYLLVAGIASIVNNVMVTGTIQAVSRFTAQVRERARILQHAGFRMHLRFGLPIAVTFAAVLAPAMGWFLKDTSKVGPIALAGFIVAGYSFYAVLIGTVNGLRSFHKQAGLDISFATMRAAGIVGLAAAGLGVYGAISGWVAAVACILLLSVAIIGLPDKKAREAEQPIVPMVAFFVNVAVYLALLNLVMQIDILLLKRLTAGAYLDRGMSIDQAATAADAAVGYYGAAQQFARLSYQAIIAATFVIFPLISRATFDNERATTIRYIRTTTRYSLIFAGTFAVVFVANPHAILDLPFKVAYADNAARALVALALGNVAFSLFAIIGAILNGAGKTREAILTAGITVLCAALGNYLVIPRFEPGPDALLACGAVTAIAMLVGMLVGGALMRRALGAFVPVAAVLRTCLAGAAAIALGRAIPFTSPILTVVEAALVAVAFLAVLVVTRELTMRDLKAIAALRRGSKNPTPAPAPG
ncbi:MAG: polysaccharide biosynthesis C-terminal domain-containing protein [Proteobacteria bacterium]|nr:polysaccharide biosynthesis C-terminal domain-containing protein [Pseudomonadota bacterium]